MSDKQTTDEYADGLSEIAVQIQNQVKNHTVLGLTHKSCPGLAVTMRPFGYFTVTHINSGLKICNVYERASSALLVMSQFALVAAMKNKSWSELDQKGVVDLIQDPGCRVR
tara:strand:- start:983 stop:1315 length:333 start_codon:yes stop_codon:yes gene_type:complete